MASKYMNYFNTPQYTGDAQGTMQGVMNSFSSAYGKLEGEKKALDAKRALSAGNAANDASKMASTNAQDLSTPTATPSAVVGQGGSPVAMGNMGAGLQNPNPSPFVAPPVNTAPMQTGLQPNQPSPFMASDERQKENIKSPKDIQGFLDGIKAYSWDYKDPSLEGANADRNTGVMAQDMEKSKLGKELVTEGSDGVKRFDTNKAVSLALAALAHINATKKDK